MDWFTSICAPMLPEIRALLAERVNVGGLLFPCNGDIQYSTIASRFIVGPAYALNLSSGVHASGHYRVSGLIQNGVPITTNATLSGYDAPKETMSTTAWVLEDDTEDEKDACHRWHRTSDCVDFRKRSDSGDHENNKIAICFPGGDICSK